MNLNIIGYAVLVISADVPQPDVFDSEPKAQEYMTLANAIGVEVSGPYPVVDTKSLDLEVPEDWADDVTCGDDCPKCGDYVPEDEVQHDIETMSDSEFLAKYAVKLDDDVVDMNEDWPETGPLVPDAPRSNLAFGEFLPNPEDMEGGFDLDIDPPEGMDDDDIDVVANAFTWATSWPVGNAEPVESSTTINLFLVNSDGSYWQCGILSAKDAPKGVRHLADVLSAVVEGREMATYGRILNRDEAKAQMVYAWETANNPQFRYTEQGWDIP